MYSLSCIAKVLQSVKTAIFLIKIVQESILYGDITQTSSIKIDPPYCAPKVPTNVIFCVNLEHITKFINVFCKCRVLVEFGTE